MDASQWEYVGEGGKHALFQCTTSSETSSTTTRKKLLRIAKSDLRDSSLSSSKGWIDHVEECDHHDDMAEESHLQNKEGQNGAFDSKVFYIRNVVAPHMSPFVDVPEVILLEWSFLRELHSRTLASGKIPLARIKDWTVDDSKNETSNPTRKPTGMLVLDYRSTLLHYERTLVPSKKSLPPPRILTIEIKPKAGYLAMSPLVDPRHRIKYLQSRFVSLQILQQQGKWAKGWTAALDGNDNSDSNFQTSSYDPLDLFSSGNSSRIRRAVSQLLRVPQNNLKIWFQNEQVVGHDLHSSKSGTDIRRRKQDDDELCQRVLDAFFPGHHRSSVSSDSGDSNISSSSIRHPSQREVLETLLEEILVEVFLNGPAQELLAKLVEWQKLDVLDVDGVGGVYERVVNLCRGSHEEAQAILDDIKLEDLNMKSTPRQRTALPLFESSPFDSDHLDEESYRLLHVFCEETYDFQQCLIRSNPDLPDEAFMNAKRHKLVQMINQFSLPACQFVLRNWLLSLAMCDVSVFLTLQKLDDVDIVFDPDEVVVVSSEVVKLQHFAYRLRLIDCDQKPAKKLKGRTHKEIAFRFLKLDARKV
mmetsp:Transcript_2255/g.4157  ORF Transcript_2255/g.4157 Transcript_2255/m.4157 type:complete len:586 (+) Transcript_2255:97-1854(+)